MAAASALSNEERARKIIQVWQNELPIRTDMVVRENSKKYGFNKKDIEKTIKELSEFIAEIFVTLVQSQTVEEMYSGLNKETSKLIENKFRLLDKYDLLEPKEQTENLKMRIRIDITLAIIRPLSRELDKLLPKKVKHHEPSLFKAMFSKKSKPLTFPSYKHPGDEIGNSELGGSKRRKSNKSKKSMNKRKSKKIRRIRRIRRTRKTRF